MSCSTDVEVGSGRVRSVVLPPSPLLVRGRNNSLEGPSRNEKVTGEK